MTNLIIAFSCNFIIAAIGPAKVSEVEANRSAEAGARTPNVIYVKTFTMNSTASKSESATGEGRPHLLGALRGGEENTVVGQHREAEQVETLAKVPPILQHALIEDLSKSVASAANGDSAHPSVGSWIITGEFLEVNPGNRALQAGVGLGAGESHLEVRAKIYAAPNMDTAFLTFDSAGASGHMPGAAVMHKNPYAAAAKFVMSKNDPEREAKKVAKAIADEIGKFMAAQGIPTLKSSKAGAGASPSGR